MCVLYSLLVWHFISSDSSLFHLSVCRIFVVARLAEIGAAKRGSLGSIFLNQFLCVSTRLLLMDGLKTSGLFLYYFSGAFSLSMPQTFLHLKNVHIFAVKSCLKLVCLEGAPSCRHGVNSLRKKETKSKWLN